MSGSHDRLLVHGWGACLLTSNEPGTDPNGLSTPSQISRKTPTVVHGTSTDDQYGSASERGFLSFDFVNNSWNEDRSGHVAGVSASFTGLRADDVDTDFEGFCDMLGVANHLIDGELERQGTEIATV